MTITEALQEAENHPKSQSLQSISARALAAEVKRLQLIVSGKTQFDVAQVTAKRCAEIVVENRFSIPNPADALFMEHVIRAEFNLSD